MSKLLLQVYCWCAGLVCWHPPKLTLLDVGLGWHPGSWTLLLIAGWLHHFMGTDLCFIVIVYTFGLLGSMLKLVTMIQLWDPFFYERKFGSFFFVFFRKSFLFTLVVCSYWMLSQKLWKKSWILVIPIHMGYWVGRNGFQHKVKNDSGY
jgi:hypothetical protein